MHWLAHVFGVDTQASYWYAFYSGVGAKLLPNPADVALGWMWWHRNNCHQPRCLLVGKHDLDGTLYCTRHHPGR